MSNNTWQLQEAKNKFSNLVKSAKNDGPQIVTKHGKETVVVLSFEEYENLVRPKTSLCTFFQESPLADIDLEMDRNKDLPREMEL